MKYSEYEEIRRNFESIFKNIHCQLTHDNTLVIQECNKLIYKLNDNISFQRESDSEEFNMGGYRERDEMIARIEKLRDIAIKDRNEQKREIDPDVYLPEVDSTPISINHERVNIDYGVLSGIDTTVKNIECENVKTNDSELGTLDSLGDDLFNRSNNNSIEIYTKTDLNDKTYLPLRYNESFNVFFGVNGYKKCNMDNNQLGYFNNPCDTLSTVEYNGHDGSVDVCDTLFNILESAENNKNISESIDSVLNVKVNIMSSLKYLCSIDDSYNEYSKFYSDCARMCDDIISKLKSAEESNKRDNDLFYQLSNKSVLLPVVKVADSKYLRAFISPSKSVLVDDSVDVLDCTKFNINASLAKINKNNIVYEPHEYVHFKIENICSGTLDESHINELYGLINSIKESYSTVIQYSGDIETYKYVYVYYVDYINDIISRFKNSKRDEEVRAALDNIGNVKEEGIDVRTNTDFSLSSITDFSKSWYDGTEDMDFFLRYFEFEDNRMLGPNGDYYTLVSDLLIEEEHYDYVNLISHSTFSKGTAIAPDGTMLKYTHGELVTLTQSEWIRELGCEDIDNSESNKKSSLYKEIISNQKKMIGIGNWKDCFPLNGSKEEFSKVPLLARCFLVEWSSNKRPVFFTGFKVRLDDNDRGLQDTSYYLKATSNKEGNYDFLYTNRIILNGKGSAVKEQDEAIEKEKKKESMRQITNDKLNSLTKGKVQSVDGVIDLTGSVLKGLGSVSGKAGNTISKFFKQSKK